MTPTVLGRSGDVTQCQCCGKRNVAFTVALDFGDGAPRYYGRDCAGMALLGGKRNSAKATAAETIARDMATIAAHQEHGGRYPVARDGVISCGTRLIYRLSGDVIEMVEWDERARVSRFIPVGSLSMLRGAA